MKKISVRAYCDESKREDARGEWNYYGILIVPSTKRDTLCEKLVNARCIQKFDALKDPFSCNEQLYVPGGCENECGYHSENNTEIHYADISRDAERRIAENWIDILLENGRQDQELIYFNILGRQDQELIYFNILGLHMDKIREEYWEPYYERVDPKIYARFLVTSLKFIQFFFPKYDSIVFEEIIHDRSCSLEYDPEAYYGALIEDLKAQQHIELHTDQFSFLDSDHRTSRRTKDSHFLQFIDLILGLTGNYVHYDSKDRDKESLTAQCSKLLRRLIKNPKNPNSRFNYYRKQNIQFFPKKEEFYVQHKNLDGTIQQTLRDLFYSEEKKCRFEQEYTDPDQTTLDQFV